MTDIDVLKFASIGICYMINKEEEVNLRTMQELGRENQLAVRRIEMLTRQFDELCGLQLATEQKQEG